MDLDQFQSLLLGGLLRLLVLVLTAVIVLRFLHLSALVGFVILIVVYVALSAIQVIVRRRQSRAARQ